MKTKNIKFRNTITVVFMAITLSACDSWVNDATLPDNTIDESQLNNINMLGRIESGKYIYGPTIAGIWKAGTSSASDLLVASGAIVDEIVPTSVPNSPFYKELDEDKLSPDNNSLYSTWSNVQNYRSRAEDALKIADGIVAENADQLTIKQNAILYTKLHAGYAWMLMADYFTVNNTTKMVYADGVAISHSDAYAKAQRYWEEALIQATTLASPINERLLHSLITKLAIHTSNFQLAVQHIDKTFTATENFSFLNTVGSTSNGFFTALNVNVRDAAVDPTLVAALKTTADKARNPVVKAAKGHWSLSLFKERDPLMVSDYDEMQLIRAELVTRELISGNAVTLVNTVIRKYDASGSSDIAPTTTLSIMDIINIRRIYLSWRGTRMIDLRRMNIDGDLTPGFTKRTWYWIGLPEIETR